MRRHILREISSNPNPVLSEPFVPSRASGRTVFPNVLSEVEGRAQYEREDLQCLYNYGPINRLSRGGPPCLPAPVPTEGGAGGVAASLSLSKDREPLPTAGRHRGAPLHLLAVPNGSKVCISCIIF